MRWLPEFLELSQKRLRPQIRGLGLSLLVGVVAGIGAIVFYTACQVVVHYGLDGAAGYRPAIREESRRSLRKPSSRFAHGRCC